MEMEVMTPKKCSVLQGWHWLDIEDLVGGWLKTFISPHFTFPMALSKTKQKVKRKMFLRQKIFAQEYFQLI